MEVYEASEYFIVHDGDHSLWCNRNSGVIEAKPGKPYNIYMYFNLCEIMMMYVIIIYYHFSIHS